MEVEKAIASAIGSCKETLDDGGNVILVLDGLDFLLAAMGCEVLEILDMIGELREVRLLFFNYRLCALSNQVYRRIAGLFYIDYHSCRFSPFSIAHYPSRNLAHSFPDELSASGEIDHELNGTEDGRRKRC